MARQNSALEFNTFVKGLITEASPLTFPANASLDERNFELLRDGTRRRRLGMDYETNYQEVTTTAEVYSSGELPVVAYQWSNASGDPSAQLIVVQVGSNLKFFDASVSPISSGLVYTHIFTENVGQVGLASVDGILVCVNGQKEINLFEYAGGVVSHSTDTLKIRDLFGVEDVDPSTGFDLMQGNNIAFRPKTCTDAHLYNLRNQTWAIPYRDVDPYGDTTDSVRQSQVLGDTIRDWLHAWDLGDGGTSAELFENLGYVWPSNADNVNTALYPNPEDARDRVGDRFWPITLRFNPGGVGQAPRGHFIIDALERGTSRLDSLSKLYERYTYDSGASVFGASNYFRDSFQVASLPIDKTPGGASCLESFAGRVWFGGFSSELVGGDNKSPRMSSYILFSGLVSNPSDITKCYQSADPTAKEGTDLVDTDGGFLHIAGAENIISLVNVGPTLLVLASNGVWAVSGGSDYGFSATNYKVDKLTNSGLSGTKTIVVVDNGAVYWSNDGIYSIQQNEFGQYAASNISKNSIQSFYQDIADLDRQYCSGFFDKFDRKIRWLYNNRLNSTDNPTELILDLDLGAFYVNEIESLVSGLPLPAAIVETPPYRVGEVIENVTYNGEIVTFNGENVQVISGIRQNSIRETMYVTLTNIDTISITFALYKDTDFLDWKSADGVGVDSPAYLVTGYTSPASEEGVKDYQRNKQVPYLTMHFLRTEDGFYEDVLGDFYPTKPSSCIVQARWDWSNSAASNRWGREFQAYRYRRAYIPEDVLDDYDTGFETIVTKNKIRGKGKVVSFLMKTEPGKDCRIQGWSMIIGVNGNV